jgi:hypothetical protein
MTTGNPCGLLDYLETSQFIEFVQARLDLNERQLPQAGEWSNMGTTVGALALRMNALTLDQVDEILEVQENASNQPMFGTIAVELGHLSEEQVQRLLEVQNISRQFELAAQLVQEVLQQQSVESA